MAREGNRNPLKKKRNKSNNKRILLVKEKAKEPKIIVLTKFQDEESSKPEPNLRKVSKRIAIQILIIRSFF